MSLLFMDGFDHYQTADITKKWNIASVGGNPTIATTSGRRGGGCIRSYYSNIYRSFVFSSEVVVGAAFYIESGASDSYTPFKFSNGATAETSLVISMSAMQMSVWTNGGYVWTSDAGAVSASEWMYLEMKVLSHGSNGSIEVRKNGSTLVQLTGLDTSVSATPGVDKLDFAYGSNYFRGDDLYLLDTTGTINNDFLGDCRVDTILPTSDGAAQEWTPSTGLDRYAMVDETVYSEADYISVDATNKTDTYVYGNAPVAGEVFGVQINAATAKMDAGVAEIKSVTRVASTNYLSSAIAVSDTPTYKPTIWEKNPNTNAQWSQAEVDAAEFGVNRV